MVRSVFTVYAFWLMLVVIKGVILDNILFWWLSMKATAVACGGFTWHFRGLPLSSRVKEE